MAQKKTLSPPKNYTLRHQELIFHAEPDAVKPIPELSLSGAIAAINPCLEKPSHYIFDAGNCAAAAAHYLRLPAGSSSTIALGMGGMGYGVASAIGVQIAREQYHREKQLTPTMVFCGDGAFLMNGFEVHTAVEHQLPVLWIVFNNQKHGMCVTRQRLFFDERIECSEFDTPISVNKICQGLGSAEYLQLVTAENGQQVQDFLTTYLNKEKPGPAVLELIVNNEEIPPFIPFLSAAKQDKGSDQC